MALRVGYDAERLPESPRDAVTSFAGVGFFFDLADLQDGDVVVDLGSASGMAVFYAAGLAGPSRRVVGIDFTHEQLEMARAIAQQYEFIPKQARNASATYGVKSISMLATRTTT